MLTLEQQATLTYWKLIDFKPRKSQIDTIDISPKDLPEDYVIFYRPLGPVREVLRNRDYPFGYVYPEDKLNNHSSSASAIGVYMHLKVYNAVLSVLANYQHYWSKYV